MSIFDEYIEQLKTLGAYDNSTIILTADHGTHEIEASSPVLLVKPAGRTAEKLVVNSAPGVIQSDLLPTVLDCIGLKYDKIGTSVVSLDENAQRDRVIRDFRYSDDYPPKNKCAAVGTSMCNCYDEYTYNCGVDEIDFDKVKKRTYEITDFWW